MRARGGAGSGCEGRRARLPYALAGAWLCVLGALLAAVCLCVRVVPAPAAAPAQSPVPHASAAHVEYLCPHDGSGCGPLSHGAAAVLTAPLLTPALPGGEPALARPAVRSGQNLLSEPLARGPDLHVLQVMRT
ncbi:hypothetical protein [Streptomyces sp. NPDC006879]|uniref:hypothetical protein n=1 Tax=Streptomyces sp. NPDC006879 TaxID=3364767 RepID=UPI00369E11FE